MPLPRDSSKLEVFCVCVLGKLFSDTTAQFLLKIYRELDDDMLFRLGDLCYRLETMCANKKQYKIFIGHLEQYNDKFWDTVRTIMR